MADGELPFERTIIDAGERALCAPADIPPGATGAFPAAAGAAHGLFAVHHFREGILLYVNRCPHLGVPLDWLPGQFLTTDGARIMCATHGAEFRISDGYCVKGPCRGEALTKVPCTVRDNLIRVPARAGFDAAVTKGESLEK
jgi:nitrite reductase/ring-hydroxylating ferredoxin subunit